MVSAVIAYSDRMPLEEKCTNFGYIIGCNRIIRGEHFRSLLIESVKRLASSGVDEIIVVNHANHYYPQIEIPLATVVNVPSASSFSEWDAKAIGISTARSNLVITVNADIIVNAEIVHWFLNSASTNRLCLYQGTKGWLNEEQTFQLLTDQTLDSCRHEVLVEISNETEIHLEGMEPNTWLHRQAAVKPYLEEYGLDLWKHSGDFQAFHRDLLEQVHYPLGSTGWGWGDVEFRLRVKEAGLLEIWNRSHPVWHMFHPMRRWKSRELDCKKNMTIWKREIDLSAKGGGWALPSEEPIENALELAGRLCRLKNIERKRKKVGEHL